VHQNARTYDEVISNRCGQPKGRIIDEEAAREAARKEAEQDEAWRSSPISILTHLGFVEEEEKTIDKRSRDKEKVLKKKKYSKKKEKFEVDKA
jgi:hypothetical protein